MHNISMYYTMLLCVLTIHLSHLQGATCLINVYSVYGNLSLITHTHKIKDKMMTAAIQMSTYKWVDIMLKTAFKTGFKQLYIFKVLK